jgi:hypothetical protein
VHVLVQTSDEVELVVVADGLAAAELLGFAEGAVIEALDLARFGVVREGVGDPAIVAAEDDDFGVGEGEGADGVAGGPEGIVFGDFDDFPFLLFEFEEAIDSFESLERGFVEGVTSCKAVNVAAFEDAQGVVVPGRVEISNFGPFVCSDVKDLALFALLVRIF